MLKVPAPRLLPATIAAIGALLMLKCGVLIEATLTHGAIPDSLMFGAANAASTDQVKETKPAAPAPPKAIVPPATAPASSPPASGPAASGPAASGHPSALPAVAPEGPPPVSDSEKALLQELRQRRQNLDSRADAVAARESVLIATEQKLAARVDELQTLQKKLEGLDAAQKQKEDAGWQGLVKVYETMKAKEAATIFNDLSMPVLVQILDRMKDSKAALIMAAMSPDRARDVTADLAQMRTGHDPQGAPVAGLKTNRSGG
jgi:flagellar motility protein MotE (MotC chaperone)